MHVGYSLEIHIVRQIFSKFILAAKVKYLQNELSKNRMGKGWMCSITDTSEKAEIGNLASLPSTEMDF